MSNRKHRDLIRSVKSCRKLSTNPAWIGDVVVAALRHVGLTAAELRAVAAAADAAAAPRFRIPRRVDQVLVDQVVAGDEPIDRKTAASGG